MSNLIKFFAPVLLASVGTMVSLPALAADTGTAVSGSSIINCSGSANQDYVDKVCVPLQQNADSLLSGAAKAPDPILMTQKLNIDDYRLKGVDAIINSTSGQSNVIPGTETTTTQPVEPWHL